MHESTSPLLAIEGLGKIFTMGQQSIHAVQDVSLNIHRGEIVGIVGESGSGKTTFGRCVLRLTEPTQGKITFDGVNLTHLEGAPLRNMRRRMQMVFQDPYASLNPRMTVDRIIAEPLDIH